MRRILPLLLLLSCTRAGCPTDPGANCTPGVSDCRGDFYCSVGGVCTKVCTTDSDCKASCETVDDCGSDPESANPEWDCVSSTCECKLDVCPEAPTCIAGHCQRICATDGTCPPDPYGART